MRIVAIGLLLLLAGCARSLEPTQEELKARWEERNVPPTNVKGDILAFMRTYLNDPTGVRNAGLSQPFRKALPGDPGERIVVCVRYEARTTSGNYGGVKQGGAVFSGGRFETFYDNPREVPLLCKDVSYEPFPELQKLTR